jgi:Rieske Fe-S protein
MEKKDYDRRAFCVDGMKLIVGAGAVLALSQCSTKEALGSEDHSLKVDINQSENAALKTVGGAVYVANPSDTQRDIIVYRKSESEVSAFSSRCSHQGVKVELVKNGVAVCPAHKSAFDGDGKVIKGPASSNLTSYPATLEGSVILITI